MQLSDWNTDEYYTYQWTEYCNRAGVLLAVGRDRGWTTVVYIRLPYWFICLLAAMLPSVWVFRHRKQKLQRGLCGCGYDLRATSERCPECGVIPAQP